MAPALYPVDCSQARPARATKSGSGVSRMPRKPAAQSPSRRPGHRNRVVQVWPHCPNPPRPASTRSTGGTLARDRRQDLQHPRLPRAPESASRPCAATSQPTKPAASTPSARGSAPTPVCRAPSAQEVLDRAIALREDQPRRTTQTLVDILRRDPAVKLDGPLVCPHPDHPLAPPGQDPALAGAGRAGLPAF